MFILLDTGMPLQAGDEVFIREDDYVSWDDAIALYGNVVYNEEGMMPVRRKISGAAELAQQHLTGDKSKPADITPSNVCSHGISIGSVCCDCNGGVMA